MKKIKVILLTFFVGLAVTLCVALTGCNKTNSFDFNLIDGESTTTVTLDEGSDYTLPVLEKDGYSFDGWYTESNYTGNSVTTVKVTEALSFYAKWSKLYSINLNVNGGTLSVEKLSLGVGKNVSEFMKDYSPTKGSLTFGGWYLGNDLVASDYVMPNANITLEAKYLASCKNEYYLEKLDGSGYELTTTENTQQVVGSKALSNKTFDGFDEKLAASSVVSENESENTFKFYYDRKEVMLKFNTNYPNGLNNYEEIESVKYGIEYQLPYDEFNVLPGYILAGWSTTPNGDVEYATNYIESLVYNADTTAAKVDTLMPNKNMTLYAVWIKAYVNMFEGDDYIYLFDETSRDIYLLRGDVYFKGEYSPKTSSFAFYDSNDDVILEGKLNNDGTYSYLNFAREHSYKLLDLNNNKLDENVEIRLDSTNGITYVVTDSETSINTTSTGYYLINEKGYYVATFTEGELAGTSFNFIISSLNSEAFQIQNEEEVALGSLSSYYVVDSKLEAYENVSISLNGFSYATITNSNNKSYYYYIFDHTNGIIHLYDTSTLKRVLVTKFLNENGLKGVISYDSDHNAKYQNEDGSTLELDGLYEATYTKADGVSVVGNYSIVPSVFGDEIVTFEVDGVKYVFMISSESTTEVNDDGTPITTTTYNFEQKDANYMEFYFANEEGRYYAPLFVIESETKASLYAYTSTKEFVLISTGTYTLSGGLYTYTATEFVETEVEVITSPYDIATIKSFTCNYENYSSYNFAYWYSVTIDEETTNFVKTYKFVNDNGIEQDNIVLNIVSGRLVLQVGANTYTGTYKMQDGILVGTTDGGAVYAVLNDEKSTFTFADSAPYTAYLFNKQSKDSTVYIKFDGKGNATYCTVGSDETVTELEGKYVTLDKKTAAGGPIYRYTSNDGTVTFEYIGLYTSSASYFAKYDDQFNGKYDLSTGLGSLTLDGYNFQAQYKVGENTYTVYYYVADYDNAVIIAYSDTQTFVFDINTTFRDFTVRGQEYGKKYFVMDNKSLTDYLVSFDGYKVAVVETFGTNESEEAENTVIDDNASYTIDGDTFTIVYNEDGKQVTLVGKLSTFTYQSSTYNSFNLDHKEVATIYVNTVDWSVLSLDSVGNATVYDNNGIKDTGTYVIISENLIYYCNDDVSFACIYKYNVEKGTATPITYKEKGYYTSDLQSLLFQKAGYAIFADSEGTTRYYYDIVDGQVYIYHNDPQSDKANSYGFVKEAFGEFTDVKEYDGKTYYLNEGYSLNFLRKEETKDTYPLQLTEGNYYALEDLIFTPVGYTFAVNGSVKINGKQYSVVVVRTLNQDDELVTYIYASGYIFYININYQGLDETGASKSTYEVTALTYEQNLYAYDYVYLIYMYYQMFGMDLSSRLPNEYGQLYLITKYGEDGKVTGSEMKSSFGSKSTLYDSNGTHLDFNGAEFTVTLQLSGEVVYTATVKGSDGYDYTLYFRTVTVSALNKTAYYTYYLSRTQELTTEDGYTVKVEKIVVYGSTYEYSTETYNGVNTLLNILVKYNDEKITPTYAFSDADGNLYYVSREFNEENVITSTKYYKVVLTEKEVTVNETLDAALAPLYESVTVSEVAVNSYYNEDKTSYVDISADNKVLLVSYNGTNLVISESTYDSTTETYTVVVNKGKDTEKSYTVKVVEGVATISEVVTEEVTE